MPAEAAGPTGVSLHDILAEARAVGFLGPGPLSVQRHHAEGYAPLAAAIPVVDQSAERPLGAGLLLLDLGSGGGLPGLVVAEELPGARVVLLDANRRRTGFLERAVASLGLDDRVTVRTGRAETIGRERAQRGAYDAVLARSFGAPATLAECAAPFLRVGGRLIVSEPPVEGGAPSAAGSSGRWPSAPLAELGLATLELARVAFTYQVLVQTEPCPERYPRRDGVPAKRPLF